MPSSKMFLKEVQHALLGFFVAAVRHVPNLCFQFVVGFLRLPGFVHCLEGLLDTSHGEELVLGAVDEKHGLGTSHTGYMGIVEPAAKAGEAVGKAAILRSAVLKRQLFVGSHHPAY